MAATGCATCCATFTARATRTGPLLWRQFAMCTGALARRRAPLLWDHCRVQNSGVLLHGTGWRRKWLCVSRLPYSPTSVLRSSLWATTKPIDSTTNPCTICAQSVSAQHDSVRSTQLYDSSG
jgi:hypothetical protein